eukprot:CAMPEP_0119109782 /NCGR_PEP_ID=MMETSP1180-20130426/23323_1 /TAXON_ID=3052 ORGANISM="Chlamydomonas cf sp, Strain CCMP681" /NCGR_SAMPLE_ID=MMETSP1180 /ASSEMBLY_ACC=CAM_ASM_000741 /LENGTH=342 /DNA_ID=CAMNT_0007095743 /DNA_START=116 /DNA_END=1144 /DNA_ORIENTATION=+
MGALLYGAVPILCVAAALLLVWQLIRLATADADLHLLSKGPAPKGAFQGKVCWVTGASQGMGKLICSHLASQGARLILSSRSADKLEAVKAELTASSAAPIDVIVLPVDITAPFAQLEAAAAAADAAFGGAGVDYLFHNAGASQSSLAAETSADVVDALFAVNTLGPIKLTGAALPRLLARGKGRVVVVASMAGRVPSPGQAVYSAAKFGLYGYFASLATEIADSGVGVTICCPGPVAALPGAAPRAVYGPTGLISQAGEKSSSGRMAPQRYVELVAAAAAHGVDEAWIAKHPVLAIAYIVQLVPRLGAFLLKKVGPSRARALKEGRSGYDVRGLTREAASG